MLARLSSLGFCGLAIVYPVLLLGLSGLGIVKASSLLSWSSKVGFFFFAWASKGKVVRYMPFLETCFQQSWHTFRTAVMHVWIGTTLKKSRRLSDSGHTKAL
jgi:hypothetical protein